MVMGTTCRLRESALSTNIHKRCQVCLFLLQAGFFSLILSIGVRYFFVASSSTVKIYSVATTRVISTLHMPAFNEKKNAVKSPITALLISPQNPFQLITASEDGHICIWDFLDGVLLRTLRCGVHISHMATHTTLKDYVVVVARKSKSAPSHILCRSVFR